MDCQLTTMEWHLPSTRLTTGRISQEMSLMNDMTITKMIMPTTHFMQCPYFVVTDYNGRLLYLSQFLYVLTTTTKCFVLVLKC